MARPKKPKNDIFDKTDALMGQLLDAAIGSGERLASGGRPEDGDAVENPRGRMDFATQRQVVETSIRWQAIKAKIEPPPPEEPSEMAGLLHEFHSRAPRRRNPGAGNGSADPAAANGHDAAPDAEGVDGEA